MNGMEFLIKWLIEHQWDAKFASFDISYVQNIEQDISIAFFLLCRIENSSFFKDKI